MANTLNAGTNFPAPLVSEMFSKVGGYSSLAKVSAQTPIPFAGETEFVFNLDSEASIVGEGAAKPAATATVSPVVIRPIKFVYQARVSDEFIRASEEARIPYLQAFADGFAKKIARGFDVAALHGLNPADRTPASFKATNSLDGLCTGNDVAYTDPLYIDTYIENGITAIQGGGGEVNGILLSLQSGAAMGRRQASGVNLYPEFKFGAHPDTFYGMALDVNDTVSVKPSGDNVIPYGYVGDFRNAFRWGYAARIPLEVIQYGDPDGRGRDLKQFNEVCLRSEVYIGWGILDPARFARIVRTTT